MSNKEPASSKSTSGSQQKHYNKFKDIPSFPFSDEEVEENRKELLEFLGIGIFEGDYVKGASGKNEFKTHSGKESSFKFSEEEVIQNRLETERFLLEAKPEGILASVFKEPPVHIVDSSTWSHTNKSNLDESKFLSHERKTDDKVACTRLSASATVTKADCKRCFSTRTISTVTVRDASYLITDGKIQFKCEYSNSRGNTVNCLREKNGIPVATSISRMSIARSTSYQLVERANGTECLLGCNDDPEATNPILNVCKMIVHEWF